MRCVVVCVIVGRKLDQVLKNKCIGHQDIGFAAVCCANSQPKADIIEEVPGMFWHDVGVTMWGRKMWQA